MGGTNVCLCPQGDTHVSFVVEHPFLTENRCVWYWNSLEDRVRGGTITICCGYAVLVVQYWCRGGYCSPLMAQFC